MTRKTLGKDGLPLSLRKQIIQVGQQIKLARKRRGLTMQEMADRMLVTRKTLTRLESGDQGVSIGVLASALMSIGLESDLINLANPEKDSVANMIDKQGHNQKQRIRPSQKVDLDF